MSDAEAGQSEDVTTRLKKVSAELRTLGDAIQGGEVDPTVLRDFREALDNVRRNAWVVQEWLDQRARGRDPYPLLTLLAVERIRRTAELSRILKGDLDAVEITIETEGLQDLYAALGPLFDRLQHLFKKP